ncbi:ATP-dependent sacrificial sulfur transferase LarE [Salibacterium salarium]|uniref:ATP-dependent sacrificial sulfur transferase LarE n=1 Tax=Salibacterium salarium TaxID=284579 RepID=A0A428MZ54_9BACI|nr:ATP-dependent sacrificial sulfur transferase LarE [Salibacterium salarium]RSL31417.1 ATP-dependent sacrificial sulfur transferase LarE [Salibacterium salarium]
MSYEKLQNLQAMLKDMENVVVAFSGGIDSTFLLYVARETLGKDKVLAVTADSETFPDRELEDCKQLVEGLDVQHEIISTSELAIPGYTDNTQDRCYLCRDNLFENLKPLLEGRDYNNIVFGLIADDMGEHRPGVIAAREHGVRGPLQEVELYKSEIRELARECGLSNWDKPSYACLSSRINYKETITIEKLNMVDQAEQMIRDFGVRQVRVRMHGEIARIEVPPEDMSMIMEIHDTLQTRLTEIGFSYVTLDLAGYKSGSMNLALNKKSASALY